MNIESRSIGLSFVLAALVVFLGAVPAQAQERSRELPRVSPSGMVSQVVGVSEITITYGRPSVRDREIFGELVPYNTVWRTGADEATTITFSDDVVLGGETVPAGTYGLFTVPGEDEWTIIVNENADQWGAYTYDSDLDVVRITAMPEEAEFQEMVTFSIEDVDATSATIVLHWDETRVGFDLEVDTEEIVRRRANVAVPNATSWQEPLQFAAYAMRNNVYLDDALRWVDHSIRLQENYNNLFVKARLLAMQGDYERALSVGEEAIELAEAEDQQPVTLDELRSEMQEWEMRW